MSTTVDNIQRDQVLADIKERVESGDTWVEVCEMFIGDVGVQRYAPDVHKAMQLVLDSVDFLYDTVRVDQ